MVEISEDVLTRAKARLVEMRTDWEKQTYSSHVSKGECWKLDGSVIAGAHQACHSWVGKAFNSEAKTDGIYYGSWSTGANYDKSAQAFLTLTCLSAKKSKADESSLYALINWLAKDSPFSQFILNRDDPESLKSGAIILCGPGGASHAEAMWVCKVLRYSVEGKQALDTWKELYDGGVSPFLAVLIATHVGAKQGATFTYSAVTSHVSVFGYSFNQADVQGLLSGKVNAKATETAEVFESSKKRVAGLTDKIKGFCKPFEKSDGWGGFVNGDGCDGPELVKRVLEWQAELGGQAVPASMPTASTVYLDLDL